jgi:hypothetical protein
MTLGVMKNIAIGATQIYGKDQFTTKDVLTAFTKMVTIDKKFAPE